MVSHNGPDAWQVPAKISVKLGDVTIYLLLAKGLSLLLYGGIRTMTILANHAFVKMNGLGNEIVVVDLRHETGVVSAEEAKAAAQGVPYDQLMILHAPRARGTDAYVRILNNDGSEAGACGNGMRCIADIVFKESGKDTLTFETRAGILNCWNGDQPLVSTVDMGKPRFAWNEIPLPQQ